MLLGCVMEKVNKHPLAVNKSGFASLYALLILQIVLVFVLLLMSSSKAALHNSAMVNDLHQQQLFAIYHIKAHLATIEEEQPEQDQLPEELQSDLEEEPSQDSEEVLYYLDQSIHITYQPQRVLITIAHMQLYLDIETGVITNLVYL